MMSEQQPSSVVSAEDRLSKHIAKSRTCTDGKHYCLYVVGIPPDFSHENVKNLFSRCGVVRKLNVLAPKQHGWGMAGFVEYATIEEVTKALGMYKSFEVGSYTIRAKVAESRQSRNKHLAELESHAGVKPGLLVGKSTKQSSGKIRKQTHSGNEKDALSHCKVCKKYCIPACGDCKSVFYCGSACQKDDWNEHKKVCQILQEIRIGRENSNNGDVLSDSSKKLPDRKEVMLLEPAKTHIKSAQSENVSGKIPTKSVVLSVPILLQPKENIAAGLVAIHPNGILYLQHLCDDEAVLGQMTDTMNDFYSRSKDCTKAVDVKEGQNYACKYFVDQQWYRVFVQSLSNDKSTCDVWYVDYGNCEDVLVENLMDLKESFVETPAHSFRCKLAGCSEIKASDVKTYILEHQESPEVELDVIEIKDSVAEVQMYVDINGERVCMNKLIMDVFKPQEKMSNGLVPTTQIALDATPNIAQEEKSSVVTLSTIGRENNESASNDQTDLAADSRSVDVGTNQDLEAAELTQEKLKNCVLQEQQEVTKPHIVTMKLDLCSVFEKTRTSSEMNDSFNKTIKPAKIPEGRFDAVVTHIGSVEEISISGGLGLGHQSFKLLHDALRLECEKSAVPNSLAFGKFCAAKSSTCGGWFRAEILSEGAKGEVLVRYVDLGNTELVKTENIRQIPPDQKFWQLEGQAVTCKLKGCSQLSADDNDKCMRLLKQFEHCSFGAEIDSSAEETSPLLTLYIEDSFTVNDCCIHIMRTQLGVTSVDEPENVYKQKLNIAKEKSDSLVPKVTSSPDYHKMLTSLSDADPPTLTVVNGEESDNVQSAAETDPSACDDISLPEQNFEPAKCELPSPPVALKHAATKNSLFANCEVKSSVEPSSLPKETADIDPSAADALGENITEISHSLVQPVLGKVCLAKIVHVVSPSNFYCQIVCVNHVEVLRFLEQGHAGMLNQKRQCHSGDACIALGSDNRWYRAMIADVFLTENQCSVYYIDYGREEIVSLERLKTIPDELAELKAQAVRCKLDACFPKNREWTKGAIDIMETLVGESFQIEFVEADGKGYEVEVYLENTSLSSMLVQCGEATEKRRVCEIDEQSSEEIISGLPSEQTDETRSCPNNVPDDVKVILKKGDLVQIRIETAKSPDEMVATVFAATKGSSSIRCKVNGLAPACEGTWPARSGNTVMAFASGLLDARVIREEKDDRGPIVVLQIPVLMNGLVLTGVAVISL